MKKQSNFRRYLQAVGYSKVYQERILTSLARFSKWQEKQGIKDLSQTTRKELKAYHEYLNNRPNERLSGGLSSATIYNYLAHLSVFFSYEQQVGKRLINPMSNYPLPKIEKVSKAILTQAQIQDLYNHCKTLKETCLLDIYYGLDLRRSEGEKIQLQDIDLKNSCLYVPKGKGGKGRTMPLTSSIQEHFKAYILTERSRVQVSAFLLNQQQTALRGDSALKLLKRLLVHADLPRTITLHSLRHSIATHLIQEGMPLEQVRDYLGHAHLESTQHYIHYANIKKLLTKSLHQKQRKGLFKRD